ncbi:MAG: glycosyltransferase family 4 protein [Pseudomonadota bacterium]
MNSRSPGDLAFGDMAVQAEPIQASPSGEAPLTVMQVVPQLNIGGVERGALEMTEAIVAAGGRALVATAGGTQSLRITKAGGELVLLDAASKNPWTIWRNAARLERLIAEQRVDLVHARSRAPAWSAWMACTRSATPFVTTYHGTYREDLPFKRRYNAVMARGRPVIAISEFIRELIKQRHQVLDDQIVVIPRGADIAVFSEEMVGNERTVKLAEAWGMLDDPRPILMMPGRLTRWKGAESVIDAAARLKAQRGKSDFLILIVGDGDAGFTATLDQQIGDLEVTDCVHRVGNCTDMAAAYKLASVVMSASIEPEAFGRVVVEAQAMGRPVIATDHGGARETVQHGITGWRYPPGDADRLAEQMNQALNMDASERAHMGMAARARMHARYTISSMQQATLAVYEDATGRSFARPV